MWVIVLYIKKDLLVLINRYVLKVHIVKYFIHLEMCITLTFLEFCKFILGDDMQPEVEGAETYRVRKRLIDRCDHLSEEVD